MDTHLITVACEGPHDVAFLNRLLKAVGFASDESKKIAEYPMPMGAIFANSAKKIDFQQLNFSEIRRVTLPSHALSRESTTIFLYSLGGDSKKDERNTILKNLSLLVQEDEMEILRVPDRTKLSMIYVFDADKHGVEKRIIQIKAEVSGLLEIDPGDVALEANGDYCSVNGLGIGCLIVAASECETGRLEDLIIPLMRKENETIFEAAVNFLDEHFDEARCAPLKFKPEDGNVIERRSGKGGFDRLKSTLGVAAQLQLSGKSNTACINDADYLNLSKLTSDRECQGICEFFQRIVT